MKEKEERKAKKKKERKGEIVSDIGKKRDIGRKEESIRMKGKKERRKKKEKKGGRKREE